MAPAHTQIVTWCGMPSVRRGHDPNRSVALDFPRYIARLARDRIALVGDIFIAQLNGDWRS